jgi:GDP-4-dehydro-6-deoxy-D-mannose reductase
VQVLLIGGTGFVGSYLQRKLESDGITPILFKGDVRDLQDIAINFTYEFKVVFYLSAISSVSECEADFTEGLRVNCVGAVECYKEASKKLIPFIFISSGDVYGLDFSDADALATLSEETLPKPKNLYSVSKLAAEQALQALALRDGSSKLLIFRPFNHIGVGQDTRFAIPSFVKQIKEGEKSGHRVLRVGNLKTYREFTDVRDIVAGYVAGIRLFYKGIFTERSSLVINLGSGEVSSMERILSLLEEISGCGKFERITKGELLRASEHTVNLESDSLKVSHLLAQRYLGFSPKYSLMESLKEIYQNFRLCAVWWAFLFVIVGCGNSADDLKEAIDVVDGLPRKSIDRSLLGLNAFANDGRFGEKRAQYREAIDNLRINRFRVLIAWNDEQQPNANSELNFNFYDDIIRALPDDSESILILTGVPSWLGDNPSERRAKFITGWVAPVVSRYGKNPKIRGFQIWNEPNQASNEDNVALDFVTSPDAYLEVLRESHRIIRSEAPDKLVISGATTAINQNFPDTLQYNKLLRDGKIDQVADIYAFHFYGKQYERVIQDDGVDDFLNGISLPLWITESGAQGVNNQLAYGEEVWPFLKEKVPNIERIYIYQFTDSAPADISYGLRTLTPGFLVSDLYLWLQGEK